MAGRTRTTKKLAQRIDRNYFKNRFPMPRWRFYLAAGLTASLLAVVIAVLVGARSETLDVVILGSALLAGYLIDLRPANRSALPVGYAVIMVLLRAASPVKICCGRSIC